MKKFSVTGMLILAALVIAFGITTSAQGPMLKQVNFSINTPYALRMGDYVLPPGTYMLHQVLQNDPNLFALHPENMTKEPIAMIRTARVGFPPASLPEDTKLFVEIDEAESRPSSASARLDDTRNGWLGGDWSRREEEGGVG